MTWQRTFAMLKPDTVQRGLVGQVLNRIESKGFRIAALKMLRVRQDQARQQYAVHRREPFYERLVEYIQSGPVVVLVLEAPDAVAQLRRLVGATQPSSADPGTIRGDLGIDLSNNLIHASDSDQNAAEEWAIYLSDEEILGYERASDAWLAQES